MAGKPAVGTVRDTTSNNCRRKIPVINEKIPVINELKKAIVRSLTSPRMQIAKHLSPTKLYLQTAQCRTRRCVFPNCRCEVSTPYMSEAVTRDAGLFPEIGYTVSA